MAWQATPPVLALFEQLDKVAPDRDKRSDGRRGDLAHDARPSSHGPDRTGNPEWRDGDALDEVRAGDVDKDLRHPELTMPKVVRHLVLGARSGRFWWIRYVIFDGIIYHKNVGNFEGRLYTGANKHGEHAHVNMDFTQAADNYRGADYGFEELTVALTTEDREWIAETIRNAIDTRVYGAMNQDRIQGYNPDGSIMPEVPGDPGANDLTVASALSHTLRYAKMTEAQVRAGMTRLANAIEAGDVDVDDLVAQLAPVLAGAVVAALPEDRDDVTADELTQALDEVLRARFGADLSGDSADAGRA